MTVLHMQSLRMGEASGLLGRTSSYKRFFPSVSLVLVVLLASWMGNANGGYFVGDWRLVALSLAMLLLAVSAVAMFSNGRSRWSMVASGLFTAYSVWTVLSILWSPNRGDAWIGAGQTLCCPFGPRSPSRSPLS